MRILEAYWWDLIYILDEYQHQRIPSGIEVCEKDICKKIKKNLVVF